METKDNKDNQRHEDVGRKGYGDTRVELESNWLDSFEEGY